MKYLVVFIILLLTSVSIDVLESQVTFLDEARSQALDENKEILMVFSGSDWCKPCIQFKTEVLEHESFHSYATDRLVQLELDFPYRKKNKLSKEQTQHNELLAERYNPNGEFPTIILASAQGEVIKMLHYKKGMSSEEFIDLIESRLP